MKRQQSIYQMINARAAKREKQFAILVDPDKTTEKSVQKLVDKAEAAGTDYFFVGGSLLNGGQLEATIAAIKKISDIPVILFPGSGLQICGEADAILFLSLISGRNPELLIGHHVVAAPYLKALELEVLSTGYLLVDSGRPTTASYMSHTLPIPYDKPDIAACTALAGEYLGMKLIYLDGGSGAAQPLSIEMIRRVKETINVPLIVGGGIDTAEKAAAAYRAGADILVVGNAIEQDPGLIAAISSQRKIFEKNGVSG